MPERDAPASRWGEGCSTTLLQDPSKEIRDRVGGRRDQFRIVVEINLPYRLQPQVLMGYLELGDELSRQRRRECLL